MSRTELTRALATRDGSRLALVPLLERHVGRLEQIGEDRLLDDPEALARGLRMAAELYDLDSVTLAADGRLVVDVAWQAAGASGSAAGRGHRGPPSAKQRTDGKERKDVRKA